MLKTNGGIPEYGERHAKHEETKKSIVLTALQHEATSSQRLATRSRERRFQASPLSEERLLSSYAPNRIVSPVKPMFKRSYLSS